jgi:3-oxo-5-alpha-steroid 4-dehydrogenase 1
MGKTALASSRLNIPGKWAFFIMEIPGMLTLLYLVRALPAELGIERLPWENRLMVGMFVSFFGVSPSRHESTDNGPKVAHYLNRAILSPLLLNPSMAPIHVFVMLSAMSFQLLNAVSVGGWLGGYGPTDAEFWEARKPQVILGSLLWLGGLLGNWWHDEHLRDIRRQADALLEKKKKGEQIEQDDGVVVQDQRVYVLPSGGLFGYVLYPHYLTEWIEWIGFWIIGGWACVPARNFVLNEVLSMLPRAWNGWHWYVDKFGREQVGSRKAVVPGLI